MMINGAAIPFLMLAMTLVTPWQGQSPEPGDADFIVFTAPLYGLRALMKTLLTYYLKYNLDTVESLINRYAPPHENATDNYIHAVSRALQVKRTEKIDVASRPVLVALARAIVLRENGAPPPDRPAGWYDPLLYDQAASLVLPLPA